MPDARRLFRVLALSNFLLYFGFEIWQDTFNNFAVEMLGVSATQIGLLQSLREIPGLMGFVMAFLVLWLSEMRVMGLSVLLLGVGLVVAGQAHGLGVLIAGTMVTSTGFHFFYPSSASLVLMGTDSQEGPKMLGRLRGVSAAAAVLATLAVYVLVKGLHVGPVDIPAWGYRKLLVVTGILVTAGGLLALRNGRRHETQRQKRKIVLRREYWLYYLLTFLMGSRRHIFTTFAIFLLVQVHQIDVRVTATLFLANNLVNTYTGAQFGRLVARFGERKVLTWNFIGLIAVFLGYAFIPYLPVLYVLFVLDNVFFGFSLAVDSYFQKIAQSPEEITGSVSIAQTINHISALVVPILGGILWERVSPAATFLAGVVIVVVALGVVQLIRTDPVPVVAPAEGH
jgi:predicted MFS family arabinose efflux permease